MRLLAQQLINFGAQQIGVEAHGAEPEVIRE
ncbi:MAG: hypothetical protein HW378_4414 [Anaerolineales bacterium]|jgi:hypothetical protein|nr:hypothetical protein [Anaerolineales bacterium]MBM2850762.1 hypothetical protein [Anaerolineales bacterium]